MSSPTCGLRVASVIFGLMCLAQLLRILLRVSIVVEGYPISRKVSAVAVVITGALCLWLWLLSTRTAGSAPAPTGATPPG
jgi:hypothetical protein